MASLGSKIKAHLGRDVDFRREVITTKRPDGSGSYIKVWNAPEPQPTEAELAAAEPAADAAEALKNMVNARRIAYGSVGDQLDMMYWDQVNGTNIWFDHIAKVKADNPK